MPDFLIFADLETGGLQPEHPNIQLAAIVVDSDYREVASFERKIAFDVPRADPEALRLNHYTPEAWAKAKGPGFVVREFTEWSEPYRSIKMISKTKGTPYHVGRLAGHNIVGFDLLRIRAMYGSSFFPFSYHTLDTLQRALWFFEENPQLDKPESLKLSVLCRYFSIPDDGAHDALTDVRMSAALARAIRERSK